MSPIKQAEVLQVAVLGLRGQHTTWPCSFDILRKRRTGRRRSVRVLRLKAWGAAAWVPEQVVRRMAHVVHVVHRGHHTTRVPVGLCVLLASHAAGD